MNYYCFCRRIWHRAFIILYGKIEARAIGRYSKIWFQNLQEQCFQKGTILLSASLIVIIYCSLMLMTLRHLFHFLTASFCNNSNFLDVTTGFYLVRDLRRHKFYLIYFSDFEKHSAGKSYGCNNSRRDTFIPWSTRQKIDEHEDFCLHR